jgi:enolase-phosphatase E1
MDQDRKSTPLKSIQGKIWQAGYNSGALKSEVFPDVPPAFERWTRQGRQIAIYSSGSVLAQKLLFANTHAGDLTQFIAAYFDTNVGPKKDPASYSRIAAGLKIDPQQITFVSDVVAELEAARLAGFDTVLCVRPGNPPQAEPSRHGIISNFDEVFAD